MNNLEQTINDAFDNRANISPKDADKTVGNAVADCLAQLDSGELRVAEKKSGQWIVNEWAKKAVLLSFRLNDNEVLDGGSTNYYDKVPSKFSGMTTNEFQSIGARVVPPAAVRRGCFIGENVVLMPSYVNIGAYVDSGTMVDTWATVG